MGTEFRETVLKSSLVDRHVINKWQRENLHMGYDISLPIFEWKPDTVMTIL